MWNFAVRPRTADILRWITGTFVRAGGALADRIDEREMFMRGIDYSYYYEEP